MRRLVVFPALLALACASGCTLDFDRFDPVADAAGSATDDTDVVEDAAPSRDDGIVEDTRVTDTRVSDTNVIVEDSAPLDTSVDDSTTPDVAPDVTMPDVTVPDVTVVEVPTTCPGTTFGGHCYFALQAAANWNKARNE